MPKKNTKNTQQTKSLTECIGGAFYDLFHPSSHTKLIEYSYFSDLIDFKELNLISVKNFNFIKKSDFNLIDSKYLASLINLPVVLSFAKYTSVFVLTFAFILSVFGGYVKALEYAVSQMDTYATNYYYEKQIANRDVYLAYMDKLEKRDYETQGRKVSSTKVVVEGDMFVVRGAVEEFDSEQNMPMANFDKHLTVVKSIPQDVDYEGKVAGAADSSSDVARGTPFQVITEMYVDEAMNSASVVMLNSELSENQEELAENSLNSQDQVLAKNDERIFRVYELNEDPKEMVYEKEILTAVNVSKVSTEPVCSFTYGNRKLASGARLNVNPDKDMQLTVDYRKDAKLSSAVVGEQRVSNNERVEYIDLNGSSNGSEIEVQVMDENNQFIGSCKLTVSEGTLASL